MSPPSPRPTSRARSTVAGAAASAASTRSVMRRNAAIQSGDGAVMAGLCCPTVAHLTPAQHEAVTHGDGPLLITGGPGTGKTRTLAARFEHLVAQGEAPE